MFRSYFTSALRNLFKRKGFSTINILGLSIGLTAFFLILQYVNFELSYDNFTSKEGDLYRIGLEKYQNGELITASAENFPALGPALVQDLPEVKDYARLYNLGSKNNIVVTFENPNGEAVKFKQQKLLYASTSFLKLFNYEAIEGDIQTALLEPFKMVITESYAKKYFGKKQAVGQLLRMQDDDFNDELCEVTAVVKDPPANTHLKFNVLISYSTLYSRYGGSERARARYDQSWARKDMYTYILVDPQTESEKLEAKFPEIIDKYLPDLAENNQAVILDLQAVNDIHLYSSLDDEAEVNGYGEGVYFLLIVAIFIVLIAYINYVNLATARSMERANEVGVRKVMGAYKSQLIGQFMLESGIINILAIILALGLFIILLPIFSEIAGLPIDETFWDYAIWNQSWFFLLFLGLLIFGTLFSGVYPSLVLSAFQPISVLNGRLKTSQSGVLFRKALVVFQFSACIALIIGTLVVERQLQFMQNQDLGYDPEQVLIMERPGVSPKDLEARDITVEGFKEDLRKYSGISHVSASYMIPGRKTRWKSSIRKIGSDPDQSLIFQMNIIDYDFVETMQMKVIAGRDVSRDYGTDPDTACLITESGVRLLGFENNEAAIGQNLYTGDFTGQRMIVGVVNDYLQESLRENPQPILFIPNNIAIEHYLMRVSTENLSNTLAHIEDVWNARFPGNPFHYFFLDEFFDAQYQNDQRFGRIFGLFAILAIIVGCLGLLGLSAFMAQQRAREIGVRKVLGASIGNILMLLTKDFMKLIIISNLIAWPLIAYVMHDWLQGFALRISLSWWLFALAGIIVLVIAIASVSFQSLKAAQTNPAKVLKTE